MCHVEEICVVLSSLTWAAFLEIIVIRNQWLFQKVYSIVLPYIVQNYPIYIYIDRERERREREREREERRERRERREERER